MVSGCTMSWMPLGRLVTTGFSVEAGISTGCGTLLAHGQLDAGGLRGGEGFLAAKTLGGNGFARRLRRENGRDGVSQIQILLGHPIHVGDGDLADGLDVVVRRLPAFDGHGVRPCRCQAGDGVFLRVRRWRFRGAWPPRPDRPARRSSLRRPECSALVPADRLDRRRRESRRRHSPDRPWAGCRRRTTRRGPCLAGTSP